MGSISSITPLDGIERDIRAVGIPYGRCDSTSTSTAFTVTVPGITSLHDGVCALVKNGVVTSEEGCTLNVNGLGAKPLYSSMAAATRVTTVFNINYTLLVVYDETRVSGGCWVVYYGYYASTNSIGYQVRTNSTVRNTTDAFRYYKILFSSTDNTKWVPAASSTTNSATSAKTVNQRPINPFGEIVYCSATTSYAANAAVTATGVWQQYTLTLGYSFNRTGAALALTTKNPVYVKCAPQSDGSAIIDASTPYVQDLPSTADGKIYIWLGIAYSATQIELTVNHPVLYHDGTGIRIWTGKTIPTKTSDLANDSGFIALGGSTIASDGQIPIYRASDNGWALSDLSSELGASNASIYYIEHDDVTDLFKIDCDTTSLLRETMSERNVLFVWNVSPEILYMFSVKEIQFDSPTTIYSVTLQGTRYGGLEEVTFNFQPASSNPADGLISTGPALWHKDDIVRDTDMKSIAAVVDSNGSSVITTEGGDFVNFTQLMEAYLSVKNLEIGYIDPNVGIYEAHIGRITYYNYSTMRIDILFYFPYSQQLITFVQTTIDGEDALVSTGVYTSAHLPAVTTNDDGKFLRVVNGTWDAVAVPNANGVGF